MSIFDDFKAAAIAERLQAERDRAQAQWHRNESANEVQMYRYGADEMKLPLDPNHAVRATERGNHLAEPLEAAAAASEIWAAVADRGEFFMGPQQDAVWRDIQSRHHRLWLTAAEKNVVRFDLPPTVASNPEIRSALGLLGLAG
jgi:hypothetical protein